jgi:predicted HicB family RNase H-like nuclease
MNKNKKPVGRPEKINGPIVNEEDEKILVRIPASMKRDLERAAALSGESMNTLVRIALRRLLDVHLGKGGL